MKRKYWFLPFLGMMCMEAQAQVLLQEDFDALYVGQLTSQANISTYGGAIADYEVRALNVGKAVKITSGNTGQADSYRLAYFPEIINAWGGRSQGNTLQVTFDVFTETTPNSQTYGGVIIQEYNNSTRKYEERISLLYTADTREVKVRYFDGSDMIEEAVNQPNGLPVILPENTWVKLGFAYNTDDETLVIKGDGFSKIINGVDVYFDEVGLSARPYSSSNQVSGVFHYDNLKVEAVDTENILALKEIQSSDIHFEVYPNPATDYIRISGTEKVEKIEVYDVSGRKIQTPIFENNELNIGSLSKGNYYLVIKTAKGQYTKKVIKK